MSTDKNTSWEKWLSQPSPQELPAELQNQIRYAITRVTCCLDDFFSIDAAEAGSAFLSSPCFRNTVGSGNPYAQFLLDRINHHGDAAEEAVNNLIFSEALPTFLCNIWLKDILQEKTSRSLLSCENIYKGLVSFGEDFNLPKEDLVLVSNKVAKEFILSSSNPKQDYRYLCDERAKTSDFSQGFINARKILHEVIRNDEEIQNICFTHWPFMEDIIFQCIDWNLSLDGKEVALERQTAFYSYQFLRYLNLRERVRELISGYTKPSGTGNRAIHVPITYSDTPPACGQIRLLAGTSRPLRVLLYKDLGHDWLVIPLSEIPIPASERETVFDTGDDMPRVYQLWAWAFYPTVTLEKRSWLLQTVEESELLELSTLLTGYYTDTEAPRHLRKCSGSTILFDTDPRIAYQDAAIELHNQATGFGVLFAHLMAVGKTISKREDTILYKAKMYTIPLFAGSTDTPVAPDFKTDLPFSLSLTNNYSCDPNWIDRGERIPRLTWPLPDKQFAPRRILLCNVKLGIMLDYCHIEDEEIVYDGKMKAPCDISLFEDLVLIAHL